MSRTATQLAGNASSIFQAWLDLKRQTSTDTQNQPTHSNTMPGRDQRRRNTPR